MRSIPVRQAALFAALAMVLLAAFHLADNAALDKTRLVWWGAVIPSVIWAFFFASVYRSPALVKTAAWITVVFAVLLDGLVAYLRFQESVSYWTPFGSAPSLSGWLFRLGWAVFLISFALAPDHARTGKVALLLAIISALPLWSAGFRFFNSSIAFLLGDIPPQAIWRALITPAIRAIYWSSQILFLWIVWRKSAPQPAAITIR